MTSLIGKARRPKFELHLTVYDLNNVPLVTGHSFIKWHLAHSMHAEHRGRTAKCPIANHRVDYGFSKVVPSVRISIDKNSNLAECPLELEVLQEFAVAKKITLGYVRLNLSEYVEESEALAKDAASPPRKRAGSGTGVSPTSPAPPAGPEVRPAGEGVVRRHLMQDSKVNSTLKIGILMVQLDGERNFVAPPLRTAPVFGSIAGLMGPEQIEDETGSLPSISKGRDTTEIQDLYRCTIAASWSCQPAELPADECIEDIFAGGNGWRTTCAASAPGSGEDDDADDADDANHSTLRPSDFRRMAQQQLQLQSRRSKTGRAPPSAAASDRSGSTVTGHHGRRRPKAVRIAHDDDAAAGRDDDAASARSGSLGSLAPTLGSSSSDGDAHPGGDSAARRPRELDESDLRDDLVAWKLPSVAA